MKFTIPPLIKSLLRKDEIELHDTSKTETALPVFIIEGVTKNGRIPLICAFAGQNNITRHQWTDLIFAESAENYIKNLTPSQLPEYLKVNYPDCALLLIRYSNELLVPDIHEKAFFIPNFIDTFIDISDPLPVLCKKSRTGYANIRRLLSLNGLTYEITTEKNACQDFYHSIYLPYLIERHGIKSMRDDYTDLFPENIPSILIFIKQKGLRIAGGVVHFVDGKCIFRFLGVMERMESSIPQGIIGSMYYFLTKEMQILGYTKLFLGGSPPFLNNGLTRHKLRMMAQLDQTFKYQKSRSASCLLLNDCPGIRDFLCGNPLLYLENSGKLAGALWINNDQYKTREDFVKEYTLFKRIGSGKNHLYLWNIDSVPADWIESLADTGIAVMPASEKFYLTKGKQIKRT